MPFPSPTTLFLTIPRCEDGSIARSREAALRRMVVDHEMPARRCLHIGKQLEKMIETQLTASYSTKKGSFMVQCQGTYLNYCALPEDDLSVVIIHDTDVSVQDIIDVLSASSTTISSPQSPAPETNVFHCSILIRDQGPKVRGRGPEPGESRVFGCAVGVIQLSTKLHWEEWDVKNIFHYSRHKADINLVREALHPIIYRQQLERFLKSFDTSPHLQYTTILLRLMIRARGLDSTSYLAPSLLQFFVYRYHRDLLQQGIVVYSTETLDHFNFARYVCYRLSEFDYRNLVWCLNGDIRSEGQRLRVLHPTYPEYDLMQNWTAEKTRDIMIILGDVARAETLEEFIGNNASASSEVSSYTDC
jgi:hypothetical protein